jgi:hypothetical protein
VTVSIGLWNGMPKSPQGIGMYSQVLLDQRLVQPCQPCSWPWPPATAAPCPHMARRESYASKHDDAHDKQHDNAGQSHRYLPMAPLTPAVALHERGEG